MLLALDPGMCSPGVALFADDELVEADRILIPASYAELSAGQRWLAVAAEIVSWSRRRACVDAIVFEKPQWYPRGKVDPNSLCGIAGVAATVTGLLATYGLTKVTSPTPREWIGQVSKVCPACKGKTKKKCLSCHGSAWETPRGRRIRGHLREDERKLIPDQNDAIDSVGIGLWALGRLHPATVFTNGRDADG